MEFTINSIEQIKESIDPFWKHVGDKKIILFQGEIGAGKTTFINQTMQALGVTDAVTSPTYSIVNEYTYANEKGEHTNIVYHFDLYRLNDLEEALQIGIEEYLDSGNYCFIEWPELIEPLLPEEVVLIKIELLNDNSRKILFL